MQKIIDSAEVSLNTENTEKRKHSNNDYGKRIYNKCRKSVFHRILDLQHQQNLFKIIHEQFFSFSRKLCFILAVNIV